jgi:LacI family transcriptional regulator
VTRRNSTIDDVAQAAGVARVTVSRVLNNGANVRPETRERVQRAVEALGYSVNQQARALASGTTRQIMLIHAHSPEREPNSYYNAGLELGALRGCSGFGLDLITRAVDPHDENRFSRLASILERQQPAGLILSPPLSDDLEFIHSAQRAGVKVVSNSAGERAGGYAIGRHLASLGHRRIAFIKGPHEHRAAALRFDGFVDALRDFGVDQEPWTTTGDFTFKSGVDAAEKVVRQNGGVTALACANDDMAAGAMLALHRAGLEIPAAISVTGFDDTPMSEVMWPPLTTIRQPIKEMTERAVQLLVENQANGSIADHSLPFELVVRESTAPPRRQRSA